MPSMSVSLMSLNGLPSSSSTLALPLRRLPSSMSPPPATLAELTRHAGQQHRAGGVHAHIVGQRLTQHLV